MEMGQNSWTRFSCQNYLQIYDCQSDVWKLTTLHTRYHLSSNYIKYKEFFINVYHISRPIRRSFFAKKCDLISTCVLWAEGKYYFQTYKYPYIYYTTYLSWDSEICFQTMRSGSLLVNGVLSYPRIYPNVYIASHVIPGIYAAKCSQV